MFSTRQLSTSVSRVIEIISSITNSEFSVRKYSAVTPGGMSKEVAGGGAGGGGGGTGSASKFPAVGKGGKKATTLFLQATVLARVSRKLGREKVSPRQHQLLQTMANI